MNTGKITIAINVVTLLAVLYVAWKLQSLEPVEPVPMVMESPEEDVDETAVVMDE